MAKKSIKTNTSDQSEVFSFIRRNSPKGAGQYNIGTGDGDEWGDWVFTASAAGPGVPGKFTQSGHWYFYSERTIRSSKKSKNWDRYVNQECGGMVTSANGTAKVYL